jgi:hypothetical protein
MSLFGGPSGSSGSGTGSTANVYTPKQQPQADQQWWNTINPLISASAGGGAGTPAGQVYPNAFGLVEQYLTGGLGGNTGTPTLFNQYSTQALSDAQRAAAFGEQAFNLGNNAFNYSAAYAPQILGTAFTPQWGNITQAVSQNPYYAGALGGAQQGAALGTAGADALAGAGNQILQTGFDPQSALFDRTQRQLLDQSSVANAMAGVGNTPYGASVTSNALGNFDINWQNNLLKRMEGAGLVGKGLLSAAPGLAAASAALPSNAFLGQQGAQQQALGAQLGAGIAGGQGFNSMMSGAQGLGSTAANQLLTLGSSPYNMGGTIANNAMSGLNNLVNLGNNQYQLPREVLQNLQQYMRLGQYASGISGNLGQMGFNQLASGIGGGLSAANSLFGSNGLFSSGGLLGGLGGGFDSGATAFGSQFLTGAGDFAGGGELIGGGGGLLGGLGEIAPLAFLGS